MPDRPGLRALVPAGIAAALLAVIVIGISSRGNVERMTLGDGRLHRAVAADLDADRSDVSSLVAPSGASLRYGRIGFPAVLWAFSLGDSGAMRYVQPLLMIFCAAAIAIAARTLVPHGSWMVSLAPFVAIGLTASLAGGFAEPLAIALCLWAVVLAERDHPIAAAGALAAGILTKENAVAILVGLVAWEVLRKRPRRALALSIAVLPVAVWHTVVAARFGRLPLLDPWLYESETVDTPFMGIWRAFQLIDGSAIAVLIGHLILACIATWWWRRSSLSVAAAVSGLGLLSVGTITWGYIGDAVRVASIFEVTFVLAVVRAVIGQRDLSVGGQVPAR